MLNAKTISVFTLLAMLLAGCAHQTYAPQPLQPTASAEAFNARSLADAGMGAVESWDLPTLTQAALRLHPDLAVARAQLKAARAAKISAGQKPNPTVSGNAEHHSRADNVSPWTMTLGVEIPVETHGKREARLEQATALSEAAKLDIALTAWQIRSRLRSRLLDWYAVQEQAAQLQKEADLRGKVVALLEARLKAGMVSGTDLADARLMWLKTQTQLEAESARTGEIRAALAAGIGIPAEALPKANLSLSGFQQETVSASASDIRIAALLNRIELRKALANYVAAEARLKLEVAKQYPDISLSPGYLWDQGDKIWSLGLSLVLPLFNKNEGPIAEARAQREVEAQRFNALQAAVIGDQSQAMAAWQSALNETDKARSLVSSQQARLAQTQRQFDAGYADRLELTTAQLELATAESAVLAAHLKAQRALGALEDAVQQPLDGSAPLPAMTEEDQ
ncbi:TolC family protein [Novimethylophilus kurashikiensis]|nr:TolC family protein [Novimethylophilus kurashikiensis]